MVASQAADPLPSWNDGPAKRSIIPGNAVHVLATFCDDLRSRQPARIPKACNLWAYQWWAL